MNEKFTTGEWGICHFDKEPYFPEKFMVHTPNYGEVAIVNFHVKSDGITEKANAHLIAAAPEMYRMLEQLHGALQSVPVLQVEIEKVLKKARGEE